MLVKVVVFLNNTEKVLVYTDKEGRESFFESEMEDFNNAGNLLRNQCMIEDSLFRQQPVFVYPDLSSLAVMCITSLETPFLPEKYNHWAYLGSAEILGNPELAPIFLEAVNNLKPLQTRRKLQDMGYPRECCIAGEKSCLVDCGNGIVTDKCLAKEVKYLSKRGFVPVASCCGHEKSRGLIRFDKRVDDLSESEGYDQPGVYTIVPKSDKPKDAFIRGGELL